MTRRPEGNPAVANLKRSVFSQLAGRLDQHQGPTYPLHVGDSYLSPPDGAHLADQTEAAWPDVHRYAHPRGWSGLIEAVVESVAGPPKRMVIEPEQVLVTAGCTGGLAAAVQALLVPGQTLLVLTPSWPLIRGMAAAARVTVRELPFYDRVDSREGARRQLASAADDTVAAVYVNSPNNPSGRIASAEVLLGVLDVARERDWWILSDDVYEQLHFGSAAPPTIAALPEAAERTIAAHSVSKSFAMAGNRVGYLVGPAEVIDRIEQLTTYTVYSVNRGGQVAAAHALRTGASWLELVRRQYAELGHAAARRLGVDPPEGGTFLFLDVAPSLDDRGTLGLLEDCLAEGLLVAPGEAFGRDYATFVRLCFTAVEPERALAGVDVLARLLGR